MRRYILTGAPGCGKTSLLNELRQRGHHVVEEAATAVIAEAHARGEDEPWRSLKFVERIAGVQRQRQLRAPPDGVTHQLFDRSPVCTLALSIWLGHAPPSVLSEELDRIAREAVYDRRVFHVHTLGSLERTAARRISYEESLDFEAAHLQAYLSRGYRLVDVPRASVAARADLVERHLAAWT